LTSSPYAPPKAEVRDRPRAPLLATMPKEMVLALVLLWLQIAIGAASVYFESLRSTEDTRFVLAIGALVLVVFAGLNVGMARRQNWARLAYLLLVIVGFIALPVTFEQLAAMPDYEVALEAVSYILDLAVLALLFTKPGAFWFRFHPA
jgi:heme A synthase